MLIESLGFNLDSISVTDFVAKYKGLIFLNAQSVFLTQTYGTKPNL